MPLIRRRTVIAEHILSQCVDNDDVLVTRYVLLRNDGLPEVREIKGGVDRIISQKFTKIALPPVGEWWAGII